LCLKLVCSLRLRPDYAHGQCIVSYIPITSAVKDVGSGLFTLVVLVCLVCILITVLRIYVSLLLMSIALFECLLRCSIAYDPHSSSWLRGSVAQTADRELQSAGTPNFLSSANTPHRVAAARTQPTRTTSSVTRARPDLNLSTHS